MLHVHCVVLAAWQRALYLSAETCMLQKYMLSHLYEVSRSSNGSEKPGFFKQAQPTGFWGFYWVLGFIRFSDFLFEQLGSLLVDLAHQLSFYFDSPILQII